MSDLDSFFAKKNKKKLKGKKFANPDDIAKRLEEKEKKVEKNLHKIEPKQLFEEVSSVVVNNLNVPTQKKEEEEEWQDFKDDREHDLTDLKLSKLQIEDDDENYGIYGSSDEFERGSKGDQSDGVWGKAAVVETAPVAPTVVEAKMPIISQPSSYLPPHLRNAGSAPKASSRKPKQAPDIRNETAFPSLGDVPVTTPVPWSRNSKQRTDDVRYDNVRCGGIDNSATRVNTANRFNALSDDRS